MIIRAVMASSRVVPALLLASTLSLPTTATALGGLRARASTAASARSCGWKTVSSSNVSSVESYHWIGPTAVSSLRGVAAISSSDVWTIGRRIEHWNGSRWSVYEPVRAGKDQKIFAIAAASPRDIWVVGGDEGVAIGEVGSLIDHWNGKHWTRVRHIPTTAYLSAAGIMPNGHLWLAEENGLAMAITKRTLSTGTGAAG